MGDCNTLKTFPNPHHCDPHLDQTKFNDLLPLTIDGVLISIQSFYDSYGAIIDLLKLGCVMFLTHIAYKGVLWALNYDNNHNKGEGGNSTIHNTKTDNNTLHSKELISAQIDNKNRPSQCVT